MVDADPITTPNSTCLIYRKIIYAHTDTIDCASCNMGNIHTVSLLPSPTTHPLTLCLYTLSVHSNLHISAHGPSCLTTTLSPMPLTDLPNKTPSDQDGSIRLIANPY